MDFVDMLNGYGVSIIVSLQNAFPNSEEFFDTVTKAFDPLYVFIIIFPVLVGIQISLATDILVVTVATEWMNTMLKWLLREDRPYWWVRETNVYNVTGMFRPILKQTPLTCETGPGSPSGHVMGAAALMYIITVYLHNTVIFSKLFSKTTKSYLVFSMWMNFILLMGLVTVSRLYVSTHFPHQCLLGMFFGLAMAGALTFSRSPLTARWRLGSRPYLLLVALCLSLFSVACYWLQRAMGLDPQWSVKLAFKWCESPEWIHVNTTPLFCLVRDCGIFFGLAFAAPLARSSRRNGTVAEVMFSIALALAFHLASNSIPTGNVYYYYMCQFVLQSVQIYLYLVFVPIIGNIIKWKHD